MAIKKLIGVRVLLIQVFNRALKQLKCFCNYEGITVYISGISYNSSITFIGEGQALYCRYTRKEMSNLGFPSLSWEKYLGYGKHCSS